MRWVFIFTCLGIIVLAVVGIVSAQTPPTCPDAPYSAFDRREARQCHPQIRPAFTA